MGVGISCISYSIVNSYLCVSCSGSITSVGEDGRDRAQKEQILLI